MEVKLMKFHDMEKHVSESKKTIYLEFFTNWCGDCKMMQPVIEQVANSFDGQEEDVEFIKVDAEEAQIFRSADSKYKVLRVPTHIILKNNEILNLGYEYLPKDTLIQWVEEAKNK